MSADEIRIGVMVPLVGPFAGIGEDGLRGADLAIGEMGGQVAGKKITRIKESTNATPDSATMAAEVLLDHHHVEFTIGPLSGNEGLAIKELAFKRPERTFINGTAGGQDITLRNAAPNFFNFVTNGAQWMAGLAEYVYEKQGYRRIATLAEDYSYPHGQIGAFTIQFCRLGGKIIQKFWVALGTVDYRAIVEALPADIDALLVALGGTDAIKFLQQYDSVGGKLPLIGGSITVDQTVLGTRGALSEHLVGMATSGPVADDNPDPAWQAFVAAYRQRFPKGLSSPTPSCYGYYINTKAALLGLQLVNGNLSSGQAGFQAVLRQLEFYGPTGRVRLDHNRQAIANNFITVVDKRTDGSLYNRLVKTVPKVNQTLGIPEDEYLAIGSFNRDNPPACP